jgi:hypothetical protein
MTMVLHLIKSLFHAFFKITFSALFAGALAAGATLLVIYLNDGHVWPPTMLIEVGAAAIGVLTAYAVGLTVLLREALHAALKVEHGVAQGIEQEVSDVEHEFVGTKR